MKAASRKPPLRRYTRIALAADWLDDVVKILPTVVVGDLFACLDVAFRPNPNSATLNDCLGIGPTRMVGIARDIVPDAAINRPT